MKRLINCLVLLVVMLLSFVEAQSRIQSQTDRDRKAIAEIRKIKPPASAIELKIIHSFPNDEDENDEQYLWQPHSFVQDSKGNYYITDTKANAVVIFDSSGKYLRRFGKLGQGPGDLSMPMMIQIFENLLVVYEAANRRLQYFDFQEISQKTFRLIKTYGPLVLMKDGRKLGAPLFVDKKDETMLVEVLSPEGKIINQFGTPIEFKWDQYSMNQRKLLFNSNNEIILVFRYLPILQKYSQDGRLLKDTRLETEFSLKLETINRRRNSYLPEKRVGKYAIFNNSEIVNDIIYLVNFNPPNLWIWAVDNNFDVINTYWAPVGEKFVIYDFQPEWVDNQINFTILAIASDSGAKIYVFAPKGI
ncbi:MAG: 6-bladed beta-propeller [Candidatus Aminicenantes bacterium]|nr:6-bladed beta-propeller [Candidatus Aminicenantes bacterium]